MFSSDSHICLKPLLYHGFYDALSILKKNSMICNFLLISTLSIIISIVLGRYLSLGLPVLHRFFDRKPFNCRPCFTFHLCWLAQAVYAVVVAGCLLYVPVAVLIALILFFIIKYVDNQKIEE